VGSEMCIRDRFNSMTKIRFSVSSLKSYENSKTTLKIYDFLGKEIATLIDEYLTDGDYEIEFVPNQFGLSTGVYFCQLTIGKQKRASKIIYIK